MSAKDVTSLVQQSNNKLIIPSQNSLMSIDRSRYYVYVGFILVVMYENNNLPPVNAAIFLNDQTMATNMTHTFANLNPIDTSKDVGLSIWVDNAYTNSDPGQKISFSLQSSQGLFPLGTLNGWNGHINKKTLPGSFYYENNALFGLVDDVNSPFIDSTDALANIKGYLSNYTKAFNLTSLAGFAGGANYRNAFIMAYSSPCPARANTDTLVHYAAICSGQSVQLNGMSIGSYTWSAPGGTLNNYTIKNPVGSPTTTTTYVALVDSNGCKHTEHHQVMVHTTPKTDSIKTTIAICGGLGSTASIFAPVGSPSVFTLNGISQSSPVFSNLTAGTYTFSLSNAFGCSYQSPKVVVIKDTNIATAKFYVNPSAGCEPLTVSCINTSNYQYNVTNANSWYVNGDSANTQNFNYTFTDTGTYTITLFAYETFRKCGASISRTVTVKYCPPDSIKITVPNVFTPNGDGINDTWQLILYNYNYTISNYQCAIYDRWGIKVFEADNISNEWNGKNTSGLACPSGSYYYLIKLTQTNSKGSSEEKEFKGFVELIK